MPFHHEKLTVYQRALEFASWSQDLIESLSKRTSTRDQLERGGDSIALNIAEGNGKFSQKDPCPLFPNRAWLGFGIRCMSRFSLSRDAAVLVLQLQEGNQSWKRS
jgi:hypothetical protein